MGEARRSDTVHRLLTEGVAHHGSGRLEAAERCYRKALVIAPQAPDGLHLLGVVALQRGQASQALEHIDRAIALAPDRAEFHDNRGTALFALGRSTEAAEAHERAVGFKPDFATAHFNRGNALAAAGDAQTAAASYRRALVVAPTYAKAAHNLGNLLAKTGDAAGAEAAYRQALAADPDHGASLSKLTAMLLADHRPTEAVAHARRLVALTPDGDGPHTLLGQCLFASLAFEEAELCFRQALRLNPDNAGAFNDLGTVLKRLGRLDQAESCHRQALALDPALVDARFNLGNVLRAQGRWTEAEAAFQAAVTADPGLAVARFNQALLQLAFGRLTDGWSGYAVRFAAGVAKPVRHLAVPAWTGENWEGRRLLVWREQGIGDELLFSTCLSDLVRPGQALTVECDPRLIALFARSFSVAVVRAEALDAEGRERRMPDVDLHCPFGSLPQIVRPSLAAFWSNVDGPRRMAVDPARQRYWAERVHDLGVGLKVGICWRSRLITQDRRRSYTRLSDWGAILTLPGVRFVNLQYDECMGELLEAERHHGIAIARWSELNLRDDLDGVAALVSALDLVITAATSVGELAGAFGVPVWRFAPAGDWTMLGTACRPWFASMRCFPIRRGEPAEACLRRIAVALKQKQHAHRITTVKPVHPAPAVTDADIDVETRLSAALEDHRAGLLERAADGYRRILGQQPDHPDAVHLLGLAAHQAGRHEDAAILLRRALEIEPDFPQALHHLGLAYNALRRRDDAMACLRQAVRLKPDYAEALTHLGRLLQDTDAREEALALHRRALAINPNLVDAVTNLGYFHESAGDWEQAEASYRRAVALRPKAAEPHNNLGMIRKRMGQPALAHFERALTLDPGFALAHWNRGLVLLAAGMLAEGWQGYDWRFRARELQKGRNPRVPLWRGEALAGRRLLVWGEQGLGDEIMFTSCYGALPTAEGTVLVECDRRLVPLLRRAFPVLTVRVDTTAADGSETVNPPDFDVHCPAGSVAALTRRRLADFPPKAGFLYPQPSAAGVWRQRLADLGPGLRVGICWRSQVFTPSRRGAYTELAEWTSILTLPGCQFVNLQYNDCEAELAAAEARWQINIARWPDLDLKNDIDAAAALISGLDLVITAATAVGELAASLGVPVWRFEGSGEDWSGLGMRIRPWYPSVRTFKVRRGRPVGSMLQIIARVLRRSLAGPSSEVAAADALLERAVARQRAGLRTEAESCFRQAIEAVPRHPQGLYRFAERLLGLGRRAQAAALLEHAVALAPSLAPARSLLGNVYQSMGRATRAAEQFRAVLAVDPDSAETYTNLGNALFVLGRLDEAAAAHERAVGLAPGLAVAHSNLGTVRWRQGRLDAAAAAQRRALVLDPLCATAHANLGTVLRELGRPVEAEACYRRALAIEPEAADVLSDLGRIRAGAGCTAEAETLYRRALALAPRLASAHVNYGLLRLARGETTTGWAGYDYRFFDTASAGIGRPSGLPEWRGHALTGRHLMVWREQGLGDEILFAAVYGDLAARASALTIACDPRLANLIGRSIPRAHILPVQPGAALPDSLPEPEPDCHIAAGSAPQYTRRALADWPVPQESGFLRADPALSAQWRMALAQHGPAVFVGIAWRSRNLAPDRRRAYTRLIDWGDILVLPGLVFVNLQQDDCAAELAEAEARFGVTIVRPTGLDLTHDLDGTASLIVALDLVIVGPVAVGELAAALGTPVWRIDPGRDWTTLGTRVRPWFPAMQPVYPAVRLNLQTSLRHIGNRLRRLSGLEENRMSRQRDDR